jgi:RNA polymerase sigma-70 factor (ECF subfamily)
MVTDSQLLDRWADGDMEAARTLVSRYFDGLARFFRTKIGEEVDDLIQQTFMVCLKARHTLRDKASFRAYMYTVARHQVYGHYRNLRKARAGMGTSFSSFPWRGPSPSEIVADRQTRARLLEALRSLPMETQILLELRYWEQLSGPELAEVLEIPEGTVRSRLRRGVELLREGVERLARSGAGLDPLVTRELDDWAGKIRARVGASANEDTAD